ncbi:pectin lyase fold/virulence factor [Boletus reticuloceps]|uniref:endo-polygalacturonase n=1 Tax=Boletus reticuloceps TaxID=495285 RepID=A0A8I2YIM0_9AGAM|nr:pectin lyase fold/virulence factor [Boletus reticuloceps]
MGIFSLVLISLFTFAKAAVPRATSNNCVGTISSLSDVSAAVQCTTVNIHSFTVPGGRTFSLDLLQGTTVNVLGDIQFGNATWKGPLFLVTGQDITFNGNGQVFDGGGGYYWDGLGAKGSTKPNPMMKIKMSGTFSDVHVVNSPARCFSINNVGPLVISGAVVDDSQGDYPNDKSNGRPAGHNTDGFDVSGNDVVIRKSSVINQDDCLAINRGKNIVFEDNYCHGGHGVSIGSITSDVVVEGVIVQGNEVVNSVTAFRIKTDKTATNSRVSNVTYSGNTARNCSSYGLLIDQSYPAVVGTPGNGVAISDINFNQGSTELSVVQDAQMVAVNCGKNSCTGPWDWSDLKTSGGKIGKFQNTPTLIGYAAPY